MAKTRKRLLLQAALKTIKRSKAEAEDVTASSAAAKSTSTGAVAAVLSAGGGGEFKAVTHIERGLTHQSGASTGSPKQSDWSTLNETDRRFIQSSSESNEWAARWCSG